ncbi:macrophage mannose receptor 1-like [Branchiostoma floridae x Branchiostoma belcheri]
MGFLRLLFCVIAITCAWLVNAEQGWDLPASCPTNGQLSLPNGKMYAAPSDEQVDYATAQARCAAEGGTVALPLDSNEQAYLVFFKNCLNQNAQFWLGVSRPDGTWVDSQGSALGGFSAWAPGEPNEPTKLCSHLVFGAMSDSERRNKWADAPCGASFRYICKTSKFCCPKAGYVNFSGNCFKLFAESQAYSEAKQTCAADGAMLAMPKDSATNSFLVACRISDSYVHVRGTCYKYFAELKTYYEAQQTCAADGAVLAMPKDSATNSFLAGMGTADRWIGLSDAQMEGRWVFADGQTLQSAGYTSWQPRQPNNWGGQDCGVIESKGLWHDIACHESKPFLCQLQPACRISDSYVHVRGTCYKYFAETKTYDEAQQTCAADGAVLAMPKDSATNSFLAGMGTAGRWIGLSDAQMEGQWVFTDGQTLQSAVYSNWKPGQPNNYGSGEDCGEIKIDGLWNDDACHESKPFICQLQPVPPVAVWPLDAKYGASDATGNGNDGTATGTQLAPGPYGNADGAFLFSGASNSYVHIPNDGQLDVQYSYTILAHIYPTGQAGPIFRYAGYPIAVAIWQQATCNLVMW